MDTPAPADNKNHFVRTTSLTFISYTLFNLLRAWPIGSNTFVALKIFISFSVQLLLAVCLVKLFVSLIDQHWRSCLKYLVYVAIFTSPWVIGMNTVERASFYLWAKWKFDEKTLAPIRESIDIAQQESKQFEPEKFQPYSIPCPEIHELGSPNWHLAQHSEGPKLSHWNRSIGTSITLWFIETPTEHGWKKVTDGLYLYMPSF